MAAYKGEGHITKHTAKHVYDYIAKCRVEGKMLATTYSRLIIKHNTLTATKPVKKRRRKKSQLRSDDELETAPLDIGGAEVRDRTFNALKAPLT